MRRKNRPARAGSFVCPCAVESFGTPATSWLAFAPPKVAVTDTITATSTPAAAQRRIAIHHSSDDRIIALLEIVSPGNKDKHSSVEQFVDKAALALTEGLYLQFIDLFPPGRFD